MRSTLPPAHRAATYFWHIANEVYVEKARVFWSGRSQAVRLPKAFRFDGTEVRIRRQGTAVILEPIAADWRWLDALPVQVDADFADATTEEMPMQDRPAMNFFA